MSKITWPQFLVRLIAVALFWALCTYAMALIQVRGDTWYTQNAPPNVPLLDVSDQDEYFPSWSGDIIMASTVGYFVLMVLLFGHGRSARRIVFLRAIFLHALIYLLRMSTIGLTMLPPRDPKCQLKVATSAGNHAQLALQQLWGQYTCTDQVFSGHTATMVLAAVLLDTYLLRDHSVPIGRRLLMHFLAVFAYAMAIAGSALISVSRMHYTVDIMLAWIITLLLVQWYHLALLVRREGYRPDLYPYWTYVVYGVSLLDRVFCCPETPASNTDQEPTPSV